MPTDSHTHDRKRIQEFVINQIESIGVEKDYVSLDDTLDTLGLDSLDVVELSQTVKKKLGIPVKPGDFVDTVTISDVLSVICERAETV
ncbi:acyl carrier protein [Streptomyces sp. IBSBF 3136]|uniref:acyl carrier protein n=1 Tax=Streptomyces sp. IBSBF 3136 TaxID=2903524 RepID=UPI002FDBA8DC